MASYELVRNTNQAVAELGEEAHMVAVPETSTFIYDCFILNVCHFQNTRPSCGVMRVVVVYLDSNKGHSLVFTSKGLFLHLKIHFDRFLHS